MKKILLFTFLLLHISVCCFAQSNFQNLERLIESSDQYHSAFPREKVFVHLDRSYYSPGDDIWLKGYVTLGNFNELSNLSRILYVDLIDQKDSLVQTIRLPITMGVAIGDFALPSSTSSGTYRIRAYTNWMRNFNQRYFFDKYIQVLDPFKSISFFGGTVENNFTQNKENIADNGYFLAVNNLLDNSLIVEVKSDGNGVLGPELNFLVQNEGEVFVAFKIEGTRTSNVFNIPRSKLGEGVNEIMLFSKDMQLLARRKIYSSSTSRQLNINLNTSVHNYSTRQKVRVNIGVSGDTDSLFRGTFSVSVIHQGKIPYKQNEEYFSSMLSPSMINSPSSFNVLGFHSEIDNRKKLDSLMAMSEHENMYDEVIDKKIDFPVEEDFNVSGRVKKHNGRSEANASITLLSPESGFMLDTISDADGKFKFEHVIFDEGTGFIVQAKTEKGGYNLQIEMDSIPLVAVSERSRSLVSGSVLNVDDKFYIANNRERVEALNLSKEKSIMLEEVKVESKWSRSRVKHSANLNGPGNADQVVFAEDLENCASLEYCLQGLLAGVTIKGGGAYMLRSPNTPMGIMIDGVWVENEDLSLVSPFDIETIEVLREGMKLAIYGGRAGGGLLIITTKRGDTSTAQKKDFPGIISIKPKGYSLARTFPALDYSVRQEGMGHKDTRATIYWNPNIITDGNGESFFEFYTSDEPGIYRVILQGVDYQGKVGYAEMEIEVNE